MNIKMAEKIRAIFLQIKRFKLQARVGSLVFVFIFFAGNITGSPNFANGSRQDVFAENQAEETTQEPSTIEQNTNTNAFPKDYYLIEELHREIPYYIFIGGMLLMIFYMLGIYFMYKDKLFILYAFFLLSLLLYLGFKPSYFFWQFDRFFPKFQVIFYDLIQVVVNIFYLQFASIFLQAKTDFPKLHIAIRYIIRILFGIIALQLVLFLTPSLVYLTPHLLQFERYLVILFSLAAYVHIIKNFKNRIVLFLLVGSFFYLSGALTALIVHDVRFMMVGSALEVFVFSLGMGYRVKRIEEEKKSIESEIVAVQLTALRAQMNPHFIFNSLNSIRAYVISNETKKASDYLNKFARLIRLILHYSSKNTIPLKEELETLKLYVELEQMRYRDDFGFELKIAQGVDIEKLMVPPLILQPYVENAIGHGLAPKTGDKKLLVGIEKSGHNISFTIRDNGVGRSFSKKFLNDSKHKSVAMELTRKRINLASENKTGDKNIEIIDIEEAGQPAGTEVRFTLPVQTE
jgi:hypothetical protein